MRPTVDRRPWWYRLPISYWRESLQGHCAFFGVIAGVWLFLSVFVFWFSWSTPMWVTTAILGAAGAYFLWIAAGCLIAVYLHRRDKRRGLNQQYWEEE